MKHLLLAAMVVVSASAWAQKPGPILPRGEQTAIPATLPQLVKPAGAPANMGRIMPEGKLPALQPINLAHKPTAVPAGLAVSYYDGGLPIQIEGSLDQTAGLDPVAQAYAYLDAVGDAMHCTDPTNEWTVKSVTVDQVGYTHVRMTQRYQNFPVLYSEIILHIRKSGKIDLFNGRYQATPTDLNITPAIGPDDAMLTVQQRLAAEWQDIADDQLFMIPGAQASADLVVFNEEGTTTQPRLAWHIVAFPNVMSRYECIIDAQSGAMLKVLNTLCNLHGHAHGEGDDEHPMPPLDGPATATANDLNGVSRTINTYLVGSTYYLVDASRPMFNLGQSTLPDEPAGAVWTINGNNGSPENNNFNVTQLMSGSNSWTGNPKAVSAHYNGGKSYEYFKNKFNRNSINGQGGTIISIINVAESNGAGMDNAYWNGQAMFYGNGDELFSPLAGSLDVAGHEMSHGVIEKTANLTYQNESGALNESFADVFGAMIDLGDWKIGEDIVLPGTFPNGALRSLQDPHNGGSGLSDFYWQPKHTNEKYTGTQDNGGVHINSGITNHAYYLFATNGSVGNDKAEQVWYKALDNYLVSSSKFIDMRASVLQAIGDLGYNSSVTSAANTAFNNVGIGSGGDAGGTTYQVDIAANPGNDLILFSNGSQNIIGFTDELGADLGTLNEDIISRPSVTDNGSEVVWVGLDKKLYYSTFDWSTGATDVSVLQGDPIWRNVCIAKDGSAIAAVSDALDNIISVYSFALSSWSSFTLTNPTTATGGAATGDVQYADFLEFDLSSQYVLYDAYNTLSSSSGSEISYWDIGVVQVWDNDADNFANGFIEKLFSQLPQNVSVGNPTWAKNSQYIIAFDYIDNNDQSYAVVGANIANGNTGLIVDNNTLGVPNYSRLDNKVLFNTGEFSTDVAFRTVNPDKITGVSGITTLVDGGYWGVWFADGNRSLPTSDVVDLKMESLTIVPNPTDNEAEIRFATDMTGDYVLRVFDMAGRSVVEQSGELLKQNNLTCSLSGKPSGVYRIVVTVGTQVFAGSVLKH
jgi:bacillolysin